MTTQHIDGFVLTPGGFIRGVLEHDKGRVVGIDGSAVPEHEARHGAQDLPLILPGFIDTHVHGGAGRDTMEGGDAAARLAQLHARHGTTSLLATTMTAPLDEIRQAMRALAPTVPPSTVA